MKTNFDFVINCLCPALSHFLLKSRPTAPLCRVAVSKKQVINYGKGWGRCRMGKTLPPPSTVVETIGVPPPSAWLKLFRPPSSPAQVLKGKGPYPVDNRQSRDLSQISNMLDISRRSSSHPTILVARRSVAQSPNK